MDSIDAHVGEFSGVRIYSLLENWNLLRHSNSELAWTLNTNNTWAWWTNFHPVVDEGAQR